MNNFFRALIAGWGAKKLGGGCLSTIVIFVIIYTLLGKCNEGHASSRQQTIQKSQAVAVCGKVDSLQQTKSN
jgi:hypothetical protein